MEGSQKLIPYNKYLILISFSTNLNPQKIHKRNIVYTTRPKLKPPINYHQITKPVHFIYPGSTISIQRKKTGLITMFYNIFLKNALYLVFDWFPLILGCRFRSPFSAIQSEFCSVASFVVFGLENRIFEILEDLANIFWKLVTYS